MKLHAVISGWLLGPHSGANHRLLAVLANAGQHLRDGERITVLHRREFAPPPLPSIAWQTIEIAASPTWKRAYQEQRRLHSLLPELGATVYDHGFLPPPRVAVPTCLTLHDLRAADGHTMWPTALARSVLRKACRRVQAIVTPSRWTAQRLLQLVPTTPDHTVVIANAVSRWLEPTAALPRPRPCNGYLLHVGHLEARKNLDTVLRALSMLPAAVAPELWLAGADQGAGKRLQQLAAELSLTNRVQHLGPVDEATLAALYQHARAVVLPSIYEGFGMPALEGLAHGLPVLAAAATALPEVLGGHGTLLPAQQPEPWAAAIQNVMAATPDADDALAIARSNYARTNFSWHRAAQQYVELWRDLSQHHHRE